MVRTTPPGELRRTTRGKWRCFLPGDRASGDCESAFNRRPADHWRGAAQWFGVPILLDQCRHDAESGGELAASDVATLLPDRQTTGSIQRICRPTNRLIASS
jgi:hypothetical protein